VTLLAELQPEWPPLLCPRLCTPWCECVVFDPCMADCLGGFLSQHPHLDFHIRCTLALQLCEAVHTLHASGWTPVELTVRGPTTPTWLLQSLSSVH